MTAIEALEWAGVVFIAFVFLMFALAFALPVFSLLNRDAFRLLGRRRKKT